ncbi:hypothetical protein BHM03_00038708 [Ensete ventricosum]|nr:hypothetical protein BHM03_00038708 [Ensete ventricosum]
MPPVQQQCCSDRPGGSAPAVSSSYHLQQEYYRGRRISTAGLTEIGENKKGSKEAESYAVGDIEGRDGALSDRRTPLDLNRGFLLVESTAEARQEGEEEQTREKGRRESVRMGRGSEGPPSAAILKLKETEIEYKKQKQKCFLHAENPPLGLDIFVRGSGVAMNQADCRGREGGRWRGRGILWKRGSSLRSVLPAGPGRTSVGDSRDGRRRIVRMFCETLCRQPSTGFPTRTFDLKIVGST